MMYIDKLTCKQIEILVDQTGKIWVNLDGQCVVRIGKPEQIVVDVKRSADNLELHLTK